MRNKLIIITMLIITSCIFGIIIVPHAILKTDNNYIGKEVFNTEQDYNKFKQTLVEYNAAWSSGGNGVSYIQALSSDPPIIVNFNVFVNNKLSFPYGKKINGIENSMLLGILLFLMAIIIEYVVSQSWNDSNSFWYLFKDWHLKKNKDKEVTS